MFSFFLNCYRLLKIVINGLKDDGEFRFLFVFIILLLLGASAFYSKVEQWSLIDALYFSVMTMATIGYGDLTPTTNISKIFTIVYTFLSIGAIVYTFLSIGTFVSFTAKCVQIMFVNHQDKNKKKHSTPFKTG